MFNRIQNRPGLQAQASGKHLPPETTHKATETHTAPTGYYALALRDKAVQLRSRNRHGEASELVRKAEALEAASPAHQTTKDVYQSAQATIDGLTARATMVDKAAIHAGLAFGAGIVGLLSSGALGPLADAVATGSLALAVGGIAGIGIVSGIGDNLSFEMKPALDQRNAIGIRIDEQGTHYGEPELLKRAKELQSRV